MHQVNERPRNLSVIGNFLFPTFKHSACPFTEDMSHRHIHHSTEKDLQKETHTFNAPLIISAVSDICVTPPITIHGHVKISRMTE
jgi:hypothetical protein